MKNKYYALLIYYLVIGWLLGGCGAVQIAPLVDGDVAGLYEGTARWLSSGGDMMVRTFYNPVTGVVVHTRNIADGFAVACESARFREIFPVGYFVNHATYKALIADLVNTRGFVEVFASLPPVPILTIIAIPAMPKSMSDEMMYRSLGLAVESDAGVYQGSMIPFLDEGFDMVGSEWVEVER